MSTPADGGPDMSPDRRRLNERGIALMVVLLVAFALSAVVLAVTMMTLNANLMGKSSERTQNLDAVALQGIEEARSRLNGQRSLMPTTGFRTWESSVAPKDASGAVISKVVRSVYFGPTGIISGQYGVYASIIAVASDSFGDRVVRRLELAQSSFARFAYFTNAETDTSGATIVFGGGDQLRGPVHSNDQIKISTAMNPAAYFYDQVTSAANSIQNQGNASFAKPPQLGVARIPMPTVADLNRLDTLAQTGNASFPGSTAGGAGQARTRIEFVTVDLGGGNVEGFFRVYQGTNEAFVSASLPTTSGYLRDSPNCGDIRTLSGVTTFLSATAHTGTTAAPHNHSATAAANKDSALTHASSRCYLGGDSILTAAGTGAAWPINGHVDGGRWVQAPASITANLSAVPALSGRPDLSYLFPLSRARNLGFKGVIYVAGKVIVSGVVRGRVTLAASGNIIFGDDLTYWQSPATRDCTTGDMIGFFSGQAIIVSNNTINAPQTTSTNASLSGSASGTFRSYGTTKDETIHGFFLTLKTFGAEQNSVGSSSAEPCLIGGTFSAGRGCLNTYGGIIQGNRGAVGLVSGQGYIKRYQYDPCGATDPPPYFPTTGVYARNRLYELDPTHFDVAAWYAANQN